ncbi:MAG: hypothetical protein KDD58_09960, partial [Bdellovibrionales bacterium]|nr:hypothetical protein [Bdellovibrionales bacterium]
LINLGISVAKFSVYKQAFNDTCESVKENIYLPSIKVLPWHKECLLEAESIPFLINLQNLVYRIRQSLAKLEVSHLYLNDPIDEKLMWSGLQKETGLRVKKIGEKFYVIEIKKNSSASENNIQFGDQLVRINGDSYFNDEDVKYSSGTFEFIRGNKVNQLILELKEVKVDQEPYVVEVNNSLGLLNISSFRSEYFEDSKWKKTLSEIFKYKTLVIDLRNNWGGNFISMLRAISPYFCKEEYLGNLGAEDPDGNGQPLLNDLDDNLQYKFIKKHKRVALKSFQDYGCFKNRVFVFVNENTGSVAEIFTQIMKQKNRATVIGQTTSGQVLLAVWYSMPLLGKGFTLSIPEANFFDLNEESFEGYGVEPNVHTDYNEKDLIMGKDSYIESVKKQLLHTSI